MSLLLLLLLSSKISDDNVPFTFPSFYTLLSHSYISQTYIIYIIPAKYEPYNL